MGLVIVCVVAFYAVIGGCAYMSIEKIHVRAYDGEQNPPNVVNEVELPNCQIDESMVIGLSWYFAQEAIAIIPHTANPPVVHPVVAITANEDGSIVTLGISSSYGFTNTPVASVFQVNSQGVPDIDWSSGVPADATANLYSSTNGVDWNFVAPVSVQFGRTVMFTDGDADMKDDCRFYILK